MSENTAALNRIAQCFAFRVCIRDNADRLGSRKGSIMRRVLWIVAALFLAPVIAILIILPVVFVFAFLSEISPKPELPETSLITLQSRTFDIRSDARGVQREDLTIPLHDVPWIEMMMDRDHDLGTSIIWVESNVRERGRFAWTPDNAKERWPHTEGIPQALRIDGYDVRWASSTLPTSGRGSISFIPVGASESFYASCSYDKERGGATLCGVIVAYSNDSDIRIGVRVFNPTDPINDFRRIAEKAHALLECIDITSQIQAETWTPMPYIVPSGPLPSIPECKGIQGSGASAKPPAPLSQIPQQ